jgi:hypothetical protein
MGLDADAASVVYELLRARDARLIDSEKKLELGALRWITPLGVKLCALAVRGKAESSLCSGDVRAVFKKEELSLV